MKLIDILNVTKWESKIKVESNITEEFIIAKVSDLANYKYTEYLGENYLESEVNSLEKSKDDKSEFTVVATF